MGIKYYPNRVFKKQVPAIDRVMAKRSPKKVSGTDSGAATTYTHLIKADSDWVVDAIALNFSAAVARAYSISVQNGRRVITDLNNYLWFQVDSSLPQKIELDDGFYTGTQLAAELQDKLDANASFTALGINFTVSYDDLLGEFTITPSSGNIRYLDVNTAQTLPNRDSIAGHLFGLNATTTFAASIVSDTVVQGLDQETVIISETVATHINRYHDDVHILSVDQALRLSVTFGAALRMDWTVVYEEIV